MGSVNVVRYVDGELLVAMEMDDYDYAKYIEASQGPEGLISLDDLDYIASTGLGSDFLSENGAMTVFVERY